MKDRTWARLPLNLVVGVVGVVALAACGGDPAGAGDGTTVASGDDTSTGGETADPDLMDDPCQEPDAPCEGDAAGVRSGPPEGEAGGEGEGGDGNGSESEDGSELELTAADIAPGTREEWSAMRRQGQIAFNQVCGLCHPNGEEDIGPRIRGDFWTVEAMVRQIRNGRGRMDPIPEARLPDEYMDDLMVYLSTIGAVRGVERPE